jgi:hypothetical protein
MFGRQRTGICGAGAKVTGENVMGHKVEGRMDELPSS